MTTDDEKRLAEEFELEEVPLGHPDHPLTGQEEVHDQKRTKIGEVAEPEK